MWPSEQESLAVWADELQAKGERLGELIGTSLRAEEVRALGAQPGQVAQLEAEAEDLRLSLAERLLGPSVGELPGLRLRWQHGVIRSIRLDDLGYGAGPRPRVVLEVVTKLLHRPALRFLDHLQLEGLTPDAELEHELLRELGHPDCVARPRRVILGRTPRHFRRVLPLATRHSRLLGAQHGPHAPLTADQLEAATARGLIWLGRWGSIQSLPWTAGDHGSRLQRLEHLLAQPWSPAHGGDLARAIWDTSFRVRRRALAALPDLPDDAAPATLAALAVNLDGQRSFGDVVQRSLTRIATSRPSWVAAVADNFDVDEVWVVRWLAGTGRRTRAEARRALPRVAGMLPRLEQSGVPFDHRGRDLRRAFESLARSDYPSERTPLDDETISELIEKIGERA